MSSSDNSREGKPSLTSVCVSVPHGAEAAPKPHKDACGGLPCGEVAVARQAQEHVHEAGEGEGGVLEECGGHGEREGMQEVGVGECGVGRRSSTRTSGVCRMGVSVAGAMVVSCRSQGGGSGVGIVGFE